MAWMSLLLIHALKLSDTKLYRHAQTVDMHPATLSRWMNRILPVKRDDPRLLALAAAVGVRPEDAVTDAPPWRQPPAGASRPGVDEPADAA